MQDQKPASRPESDLNLRRSVVKFTRQLMRSLIRSAPRIIIVIVITMAAMLVFKKQIGERLSGVDRVIVGGTTVYFTQPISNTSIKEMLSKITTQDKGVQFAYLRNKLEQTSDEVSQMQQGELRVSTPAAIFNELMTLVRSTSRGDIWSINHRPEVWSGGESELGYTYEEYLKANIEAQKRGVRIHRLIVFPRSQNRNAKILNVLRKHLKAGVDVRYAFVEEISKVSAYQQILSNYTLRNFGIPFDETNLVIYEGKVIGHTLRYGGPPHHHPTMFRVTWKKEDLSELNPEPLFQAGNVYKFSGQIDR